MTAKEKAEKIIDKLMWCCTTSDQTAPLCKDVAKQCALICVDEMYEIVSQNDNVIQMNYLVDVRKELELL